MVNDADGEGDGVLDVDGDLEMVAGPEQEPVAERESGRDAVREGDGRLGVEEAAGVGDGDADADSDADAVG